MFRIIRRTITPLVVTALAAGAMAALPATGAHGAPGFDPSVQVTRSNDAARQPTNLRLVVEQDPDEEQIRDLALKLERQHLANEGFVLDTDVPNTSFGQAGDHQIGVVAIEIWTTGDVPVTLDGTIHDDNDRDGCGVTEDRQCIVLSIDLSAIGQEPIEAQVEIEQAADPTFYSIKASLSEALGSPEAQAINARLKRLDARFSPRVGSHVVLMSPAVGGADYDFVYELTSTEEAVPDCGPTCTIALPVVEYAPGRAGLSSPASSGVITSASVTFEWRAAVDPNGDPVSYALVVATDRQLSDVVASATTPALTATVSLDPGRYHWQVTAIDDPVPESVVPQETGSLVWSVAVIDEGADTTLTFTDAVSDDQLIVSTSEDVFIYREADGTEHAGFSSDLDRQGVLLHTTGFVVGVAYDADVGSASGSAVIGGIPRQFVDPPDAVPLGL